MKKRYLIFIMLFLVFISGCDNKSSLNIGDKCIEICNSANFDLNNGPCLSDDNPEWDIDDWVCDVAHEPRIDIDDLPENQCREFREGKANHFVEVDNNCKIIIEM